MEDGLIGMSHQIDHWLMVADILPAGIAGNLPVSDNLPAASCRLAASCFGTGLDTGGASVDSPDGSCHTANAHPSVSPSFSSSPPARHLAEGNWADRGIHSVQEILPDLGTLY